MSTEQHINIGLFPDDGTGDPLRIAFSKANENFDTLWGLNRDLANVDADTLTYVSEVFKYTNGAFNAANSAFSISSDAYYAAADALTQISGYTADIADIRVTADWAANQIGGIGNTFTDLSTTTNYRVNTALYIANTTANLVNGFAGQFSTAFEASNAAFAAANGVFNQFVFAFDAANAAYAMANTVNSRPAVYDVGGFVAGTAASLEKIFQFNAVRPVEFEANFNGSTGTTGINSTGNAIFTVYKNSSNVGTMIFSSANPNATFSTANSSPVVLLSGDYLRVVAPFAVDGTLADFSFTFRGITI